VSRLAVPVKLVDRVWTYRDADGTTKRAPLMADLTKPPYDVGRWESLYAASCNQCDWTQEPSYPKVAVEEQARWHRQQHRRGDL
jgi:hypothetical protein